MTTPLAQRTIGRPISVTGIGFFGGSDVELTFQPAGPNEGITFVRTDVATPVRIPAQIGYLAARRRRTALEHAGANVEMVEHVMAALFGLGIDNCEVRLNAPETPGCDGSSRVFVDRLLEAGTVEQGEPRRPFVVRRSVCVKGSGAVLAAYPGPPGRLLVSYVLDYGPASPIGLQSRAVDVNSDSFRYELAASRTFLLVEEAEQLRSQGIGTRVGYRDLLIFGPDGVVDNKLRYEDECVRHKILDMVGDLGLLGVPVEGHIVAYKSGHRLNADLVRALLKAHQPVAEVPPVPAPIDAVADHKTMYRAA